jgi:hypothetical protein
LGQNFQVICASWPSNDRWSAALAAAAALSAPLPLLTRPTLPPPLALPPPPLLMRPTAAPPPLLARAGAEPARAGLTWQLWGLVWRCGRRHQPCCL